MKTFNLLSLITLLTLSVACEQQREGRAARSSNLNANPQFSTFNNGNSGGGNGSGDGTLPIEENNNGAIVPVEISHCSWSTDGTSGFASYSNHLNGGYTLCQSSANPKDIYMQVQTPAVDAQVCLIPISHNEMNQSVYIGEPRCLILNSNQMIYKVTMVTNRQNFENASVTGVMVMKDLSLFYPYPFNQYVLSPDAYLFCSNYLDLYGDPSYCQAFQSVGQYVHYKF